MKYEEGLESEYDKNRDIVLAELKKGKDVLFKFNGKELKIQSLKINKIKRI